MTRKPAWALAAGMLALLGSAGPARAADAPLTCPPGWHDAPGGTCVLAQCPGHQCRPGEECRPTSLCFMARKQGDVSRRPGEKPEALVVDEALDVCVGGAVCTPSATCANGGVCLAPGAIAARAPKNASPDPTPYNTAAPPPEAPRGREPEKKGGCGGCAVESTRRASPVAFAAGIGLALILARRTRTRRRAA